MTVIIQHANLSQAFINIPILQDGTITALFCQGGMCVFLILSGYGLFKSYLDKGFLEYWDNKFNKIFLPAIIIQFVFLVIKLLDKVILGHDLEFNIYTILGDILCVNQANEIDGSIWYLSYLLYCYIVFYVIFRYIKRIDRAMLVFGAWWILSMPICRYLWISSFYCVSAFAVGVFLSYIEYKWRPRISKPLKVVLLGLFIMCGAAYYFNFRPNRIIDNLASNLVAFAFIILISFCNVEKLRILRVLGLHSFSMYLLQGKVIFGIFPYENYSANVRLFVFVGLFILNCILAIIYDSVTKTSHTNKVC